jgi:hypothetical protein
MAWRIVILILPIKRRSFGTVNRLGQLNRYSVRPQGYQNIRVSGSGYQAIRIPGSKSVPQILLIPWFPGILHPDFLIT